MERNRQTDQAQDLNGFERMALAFFLDHGLVNSWSDLVAAAFDAFPNLERTAAVMYFYDVQLKKLQKEFKSEVTEEDLRAAIAPQFNRAPVGR